MTLQHLSGERVHLGNWSYISHPRYTRLITESLRSLTRLRKTLLDNRVASLHLPSYRNKASVTRRSSARRTVSLLRTPAPWWPRTVRFCAAVKPFLKIVTFSAHRRHEPIVRCKAARTRGKIMTGGEEAATKVFLGLASCATKAGGRFLSFCPRGSGCWIGLSMHRELPPGTMGVYDVALAVLDAASVT